MFTKEYTISNLMQIKHMTQREDLSGEFEKDTS